MTATQDWEMANQSKSSISLEKKTRYSGLFFPPFLSSFTALHVGPQEKFLLPFQKKRKAYQVQSH